MTTLSGTADFQLNRNDLISASLRAMSVIGVGDTASADDITNLSQALNLMVKAWHIQGIQLWTIQSIVLTPVIGKVSYLLGPGGGKVAAVTMTNKGSGYTSAPTVTFSASPTGVTATGTATVSGGEVTGVTVTNGGTKYVTPPTITFTGGGGADAAAVADMNGRFMTRPLRIVDAFVRQNSSLSDSPMTPMSRREYQLLGIKTSKGQPHSYYYDAQLDDGVLFVYVAANAHDKFKLHFSVQRPLQDVNLATENVDVPQEWFQALKWSLADEVSSEYGLSEAMMDRISQKANFYRQALSEWDGAQENTSVWLTAAPERVQGGGW